MEVLGAVAAAGQLVGTAIGILDSISQLRDFLRYAPDRYKGWLTELSILGDTIACIIDNSALHTCQVKCIIESMGPKIATLKSLCSRYIPQPKRSLISRLNNAFSALTAETRILQSLDSLEHDKTTLLLTISTLKESSSSENSRQPTPEPEKPKEDSQNTYQEKEGSSGSYCRASSETMAGRNGVPLFFNQASQGFQTNDPSKSCVIRRPLANYVPPQSPPSAGQSFKMTGNTIQSKNSSYGNTSPGSFDMDNNKIESEGELYGNHSPTVTSDWLKTKNPGPGRDDHAPSGRDQPRNGAPPNGN